MHNERKACHTGHGKSGRCERTGSVHRGLDCGEAGEEKLELNWGVLGGKGKNWVAVRLLTAFT